MSFGMLQWISVLGWATGFRKPLQVSFSQVMSPWDPNNFSFISHGRKAGPQKKPTNIHRDKMLTPYLAAKLTKHPVSHLPTSQLCETHFLHLGSDTCLQQYTACTRYTHCIQQWSYQAHKGRPLCAICYLVSSVLPRVPTTSIAILLYLCGTLGQCFGLSAGTAILSAGTEIHHVMVWRGFDVTQGFLPLQVEGLQDVCCISINLTWQFSPGLVNPDMSCRA